MEIVEVGPSMREEDRRRGTAREREGGERGRRKGEGERRGKDGGERERVGWLYDDMLLCSALLRKTP